MYKDTYKSLSNEFLNQFEKAGLSSLGIAVGLELYATRRAAVSGLLKLVPRIFGLSNGGGEPSGRFLLSIHLYIENILTWNMDRCFGSYWASCQ